MTKLDRDRFIKFMGMTASNSDGEALAFIRKANAMLKAANMTWSDVIPDREAAERKLFEAFTHHDLRPTGTGRYGRPVKRTKKANSGENRDPSIGPMLEELRTRQHTMSFLMFLSGVTAQWRTHGYLNDAQYGVIKQAYSMSRSPF